MSSQPAPDERPSTRTVARAAVQAELSLAAYELVVERGFENVTLDDMAAAGGVSRSTFLRYFRTKDQAVVVALQAHAARMADVLRARPADEDDWTALRMAVESFVLPIYQKNPAGAQAITQVIMSTPTLYSQVPNTEDWRMPLTRALAERAGIAEPFPFGLSLKVAVALQCMGMANTYWASAYGQEDQVDLGDLIDEGFAILSGADVPAPSTR